MDELDRTLRLADDVLRHKIVRIPEAAAGRKLPAATAQAAPKEESSDG
jgi:ribosomal protein S6